MREPGFYHKDTDSIYIFPDRIKSDADLVKVMAHEALHQGIRSAFGDKLDGVLFEVLDSVDALPENHPHRVLLNSLASKYGIDPTKRSAELAEEFVSEASETAWFSENPGTLRKVYDYIKENILRVMGNSKYKPMLTDRLLMEAIHQSRKSLSNFLWKYSSLFEMGYW